MNGKIVAMGEIMLRLSTPDYTPIEDARSFDACYGGSEANVLAALSSLGHATEYISVIPPNPVGDGAIGHLTRRGVGTKYVLREGETLGSYFLEQGFGERPSRVIYNRKHAAVTEIKADRLDYDGIFRDSVLFHVSGISLALSKACRDTVTALAAEAKRRGIRVSFDFNYRSKLWSIEKAAEAYKAFVGCVDICFCNLFDLRTFLGLDEKDDFKCVEKFMRDYDISYTAYHTREAFSATRNRVSGRLYERKGKTVIEYAGGPYEFDVLDRIGAGDSFSAGILHVLAFGGKAEDALRFGLGCDVLKHTERGDVYTLGVQPIEAFLANNSKDVRR